MASTSCVRSGIAVGVTASFVIAGLVAPVNAEAARALHCRATMSNYHPRDYTTTHVLVRTASRALVRTVAHYKTTDHAKTRRANRRGRADVPYDISGATPGYRVNVSVTVHKGRRAGHCSTSFTPKG